MATFSVASISFSAGLRFGVGVGHLGDEGGLSHRGETDQRNGRISGFSDFKPFTATAGF